MSETLTPLRCEANGCTGTIPAGKPETPSGEPGAWTIYRVPPGWAVSWVIGDGSDGFLPSSRMVVLCPLHHVL